jgi:hypothetical protein
MPVSKRVLPLPALLEEHAALADLIAQVRGLLSASASSPAELDRRLADLERGLAEHFEHEEQGGYFAEALDAAPHLADRAEALLGEHADLARRLACLRQLVARREGAFAWRQLLQDGFREFFARFSNHEASENWLVQEAFQHELGMGD